MKSLKTLNLLPVCCLRTTFASFLPCYGCEFYLLGEVFNMNTAEVLENGHLLLIQVVDGLPEEAWDMPSVCGNWSVKDIVAHLASYEQLILDIVSTFPVVRFLRMRSDGSMIARLLTLLR